MDRWTDGLTDGVQTQHIYMLLGFFFCQYDIEEVHFFTAASFPVIDFKW